MIAGDEDWKTLENIKTSTENARCQLTISRRKLSSRQDCLPEDFALYSV